MRAKWLAAAACLAMAACSSGTGAGGNTSAATGARSADWAKFRDGFIEGWFKIDPANAVYQGRHDFDGGIGDWSAAGLKRQADFLHRAIDQAKAFKDGDLKPNEKFERDYLVKVADGKLFWLEDADQ